MKPIILTIGLGLFLGLSGANAQVSTSRSLQQFGAAISWGADTGWAKPGTAMIYKSFAYVDAGSPSGSYFTVLNSSLMHTAGGSVLADTRLFTYGWHQEAEGWRWSIDFSPVLGARYDGHFLLGSSYCGLGASLAVFFPISEAWDIGFGWEPVLNLYNWGAPVAPNQSYHDLVFYFVWKQNNRIQALGWNKENLDRYRQ